MKSIIRVATGIALICLALSGCVYVQESHTRDKGTQVDQKMVAKVEPGKTTKEWVLTNLGAPDRIHAERDGLEIFEYANEKHERTERKFIFLFSVGSDKVLSHKTTRVVMRNGVVDSITTTDG